MINKNRLADRFKSLVEIESESGNEKQVAGEIAGIAESLGASTAFDNSWKKTKSNTGNLIVKFQGTADLPPLLLSAHMDTVSPGRNITAVLNKGVFFSEGDTILGADDKSAIAIILEVMEVIMEKKLPHPPIEILLTTCEEIGLKGAKNLDLSMISARQGYVLDTTDVGAIVIKAPAANRLCFKVHGKDSHAGVAPEDGINAISIASKAIAGIDIGRIDADTTCNLGKINGGVATNIVPSLVSIDGEVRSHNEAMLAKITENIIQAFKDSVDKMREKSSHNGLPRLDVEIERDFPLTNVPKDHSLVITAGKAAENLGKSLIPKSTGGGSDANILFQKGIMTGVLGTGMRDMHTLRESINLKDMNYCACLLLEIIKLHSQP